MKHRHAAGEQRKGRPFPVYGVRPFDNESMNTVAKREFLAAAHRLDRENRWNGLIPIPDLRKRLPHLTPRVFDDTLAWLHYDAVIAASIAQSPATVAHREAGFETDHGLIYYVQLR